MNLVEFIANSKKPVFLDGGMGTQLFARGVEMSGNTNLTHPEVVLAVHQDYADAGANVLISNTFTLNRIYQESNSAKFDIPAAIQAGVKIAKQAATNGQFVVGDMGSTSKMLAPIGKLTEEEALETYIEQATTLAEAGVDGFFIETMFDIHETLVAVKGCKTAAPDIPVMASMTFVQVKNGGRTMMGNSAQECAQALTDAGVSVVGTNCGKLNPEEIAEIVAIMGEVTDLPIAAQPNAGLPKMRDGETYFDMQPDTFADGIEICVEKGAKVVGGCCGTTPDHIREIVKRLG